MAEYTQDSSAKSSLLVTVIVGNSAKANIPAEQANSVKAEIHAPYPTSAKANILKTESNSSFIKASLLKAKLMIPSNIKNTSFGTSDQPGQLHITTEEKILDDVGLISGANFKFGTITVTSQCTTTSTTTIDVPGMSITFTLERAANVFIFASVTGGNTSMLGVITMIYLDEGVQQIGNAMLTPGSLNATHTTIHWNTAGASFVQELATGTHTLKLVYNARYGGTAYLSANPKILGYIVLGK